MKGKTKYLPSTYIKFWWSNFLIDTHTKIGSLIMLFVVVGFTQKILKKLSEYKKGANHD